MIMFVVFDVMTGAAVRWGSCQIETLAGQAQDGQVVLQTSSLDVSGNRQVVWEAVRSLRAIKVAQGANTPYGIADSDDEARGNISGASLAALIAKTVNAAYSVVWTLQDNSSVTLDADGMIALGLAVMAHVDQCHVNARRLRTLIDECANMAELLALEIEDGWPA